MPRWTEHTDKVLRVLEQQAERDSRNAFIANEVRRIGAVTRKAKRFDFGRRVRRMHTQLSLEEKRNRVHQES